MRQALEDGVTLEEVHDFTNIDPWFLAQLEELHQAETWLQTKSLTDLRPEELLQLKKRGFSDIQISRSTGPAHAAPCTPDGASTCVVRLFCMLRAL